MFTEFIYRHIQIGVLYVNKPFYELLSEKNQSFFTFLKIITLFHNAFCYETAIWNIVVIWNKACGFLKYICIRWLYTMLI